MRYICVYQARESSAPPDPKQMAAVGNLIAEMNKAGVLLATEGCAPSASGFRLRAEGGKVSLTDGPFAEIKEPLAGYCLIQVKSKADAVEWSKRFMSIMGEGSSEVRLLREPQGA